VAATWGLAAARREKIKQSELENFDFWIRDRSEKLLGDLAQIAKDYKSSPIDTTDTIVLNTISLFSRRVRDQYYGVIHVENHVYWRELDVREKDTLSPHLEALQNCCDDLDEAVKQTKSYQDISEKCIQAEFELGDLVNHVRNRISHGKGLFKFWVFRSDYSR
jgi:hypothetical protein